MFVTEPWWLQTYIVFTQGAEKFFLVDQMWQHICFLMKGNIELKKPAFHMLGKCEADRARQSKMFEGTYVIIGVLA